MFTSTLRKIVPSYGYSTPDRAEVYQEYMQTQYTPDVSVLEEYEWQLFFAVDELKKDHFKHSMLGDEAEYKCPAFTQQDMQFWQAASPMNSPVPMEAGLSSIVKGFAPAAKIKGQVYKIRPQQIINILDKDRQNGVEFIRKRVRLIVPYRMVVWVKDHNLDPDFGSAGEFCRSDYLHKSIKHTKERVGIIRAWMYIGNPNYWDKLISAYDNIPVETFHAKNRQWCKTYYHIRRPDLPPK